MVIVFPFAGLRAVDGQTGEGLPLRAGVAAGREWGCRGLRGEWRCGRRRGYWVWRFHVRGGRRRLLHLSGRGGCQHQRHPLLRHVQSARAPGESTDNVIHI